MTLIAAIFLMTSATILAAVEDYLRPLIVAGKGIVSVAETESDALEELAIAPDKWRVVLCMDGDKAIDPVNPGGLVEGRMTAYVQAPKGFEIQPSRNLHRAALKGTPAFFNRLHWTIRKLRGLVLVAPDIDRRGFRYHGWQWLRFEGTAIFRCARADFDLLFAHDDPATDPDGSEPIVLPLPFRIVGANGPAYIVSLNGVTHGRVQRFEAEPGDPNGTATGYAITSTQAGFYTVALDGTPHGRIPIFDIA